eukprot:9436725-Lingulodinium_polyedra.AAC.1
MVMRLTMRMMRMSITTCGPGASGHFGSRPRGYSYICSCWPPLLRPCLSFRTAPQQQLTCRLVVPHCAGPAAPTRQQPRPEHRLQQHLIISAHLNSRR